MSDKPKKNDKSQTPKRGAFLTPEKIIRDAPQFIPEQDPDTSAPASGSSSKDEREKLPPQRTNRDDSD